MITVRINNLTHEFLYDNLIKFIVKIVMKKLMCQINAFLKRNRSFILPLN